MEPFLVFEGTPTQRPVPEGWMIQPVGDWNGGAALVAYDPRRYQVMLANGVTAEQVDLPGRTGPADALYRSGWEPYGFDHGLRRSLWVRDLLAVARAGLGRPEPQPARDPIGLEL